MYIASVGFNAVCTSDLLQIEAAPADRQRFPCLKTRRIPAHNLIEIQAIIGTIIKP